MRQLELELHAGLAFGTLHHFIALIRAAIKSGHPNAQAISSANSDVSSAEFNSSSAGQPIKETVGGP